jgi:hypothetical protein
MKFIRSYIMAGYVLSMAAMSQVTENSEFGVRESLLQSAGSVYTDFIIQHSAKTLL